MSKAWRQINRMRALNADAQKAARKRLGANSSEASGPEKVALQPVEHGPDVTKPKAPRARVGRK